MESDIMPSKLNEENILICCALRFDGYQYNNDHDVNVEALIHEFFKTGQWQGTDAECLSAFFHLQRSLFKWGLVYEPSHGRYWRAFRELFLRLYDVEIPIQYQLSSEYSRWMLNFQPRLDECVAIVRQVHESTAYDDQAKPQF